MSKKNPLDQYKDPLGLTPKKMNFGLWYVSNRNKFRKILITFLILVSLVTWFITIFTFTRYIFVGMKEDEEISRQITENILADHEYILKIAPDNLKLGRVSILKHLNKYDLIAEIQNPSNKYWAYFDYIFVLDGKETKRTRSFILPGESKYLTNLAYELRPQKAAIKIENIAWSKVDKHKIPDWKDFHSEHFNLQFNDVNFIQSKKTGLSEKLNVSSLEFKAVNSSPYNYWQVLLTIALYKRDNIVSINEYSLNEFKSGEERDVSISIPGIIGDITKTEIIPAVDITRNDIYMKY